VKETRQYVVLNGVEVGILTSRELGRQDDVVKNGLKKRCHGIGVSRMAGRELRLVLEGTIKFTLRPRN
jgi:hypothetical protein